MNYSPLRYPGGKAKLASRFRFLFSCMDNVKTYVEPFAGGAGAALDLLINGSVDNIILNDIDISIYSIWRAVLFDTDDLVRKIRGSILTVAEWQKQKFIYSSSTKYSLDYAYATLYLNRTNRSGILTAGPIGGYNQTGTYRINARFNTEAIISKIQKIAQFKEKITISNHDIREFLVRYGDSLCGDTFIYFDPPYVERANRLYKNSLTPIDHINIEKIISKHISCNWVMTYDNSSTIQEIYSQYNIVPLTLNYSAANRRIATELLIFSSDDLYSLYKKNPVV